MGASEKQAEKEEDIDSIVDLKPGACFTDEQLQEAMNQGKAWEKCKPKHERPLRHKRPSIMFLSDIRGVTNLRSIWSPKKGNTIMEFPEEEAKEEDSAPAEKEEEPKFVSMESTPAKDFKFQVGNTVVVDFQVGDESLQHFGIVDQIDEDTSAMRIYFIMHPFSNAGKANNTCYIRKDGWDRVHKYAQQPLYKADFSERAPAMG